MYFEESSNKDPWQGSLKCRSKFGADYDMSQLLQNTHKTGILLSDQIVLFEQTS